jgi:hypothetical protein
MRATGYRYERPANVENHPGCRYNALPTIDFPPEPDVDIRDFGAGSMEQRYQYAGFLPEPINHAWVLSDPECLTLLDDASRLLGELNAFSQLIPDVDFFIKMHVAKEATTSSRIEGTQTNHPLSVRDHTPVSGW